VIARSRADALRGRLADLPQAQAQVIALAYYGGLSHTEIAARLALPAGTVKGRMRLGLQKLRDEPELVSSPAGAP
jgi:RNA polymerase sigma-70 factor, ECF subfamily